MATSKVDITSDEIIHIKCCFCLEENRIREADKYCVQCKNYYCTPCTGIHEKFPLTKGHKLLDKADFRSLGPDGSLPSLPTQRCSEHPTEVINLYCKDHDEVACVLCIALTHSRFRTCSNIQPIPDVVDKVYCRTQLADTQQKIHKAKSTMQEIKTVKEHQVQKLKTDFDKEVQSVHSFRQELQALIEKMEQETIRELKKEFDRIESCLTIEINEINKLIDAMNEAASLLKKSEGNLAQEFVTIKTSQKITANADAVAKKHQRKNEGTFSFTADWNIKAFIQQLQKLGKVSRKEHSIITQKESLYKIKQRRQFIVNLSNDFSYCSIWGSCFTEDGSVLLADNKNIKLMRLDMSTETVKDYIDLQAAPYAVCLISKTEAAVTLNNDTVQFVTLDYNLTATRNLQLYHDCRGLAHLDNKLFISDDRRTVYIHDMDGNQLQKISKDASGKNIFQWPKHITVSAAKDRVFVADYRNGLVTFDHKGRYQTTLTDPTVIGTQGVCTDGRNLFVCGLQSKNIVQIGHNNKLLGEIGKVDRDPLSLCFDPHTTRLVVTSGNNITVLELE